MGTPGLSHVQAICVGRWHDVGMPAKPFNVRMEEDLREAISKYRALDGVQNDSVWAREALAGVVALGGLQKLRDVLESVEMPFEAHPARSLALQASPLGRSAPTGECTHPPTARRQLPFSVVCGLCGSRVK